MSTPKRSAGRSAFATRSKDRLQRDQGRLRVNAQLIDTETGAHLWADVFDEDVADLLKVQDQVVARLARSVGPELVRAEAGKPSSKNPDAVDLAIRG